jgi:hypothetical protein
VIAFICGLIVIILMIMALASTDWLMAAGWRQGLFIHCIADDAPVPLPFNVQDPPDCYQARDVGKLCASSDPSVQKRCAASQLYGNLQNTHSLMMKTK